MFNEILLIALILILFWFWHDTMRAREIAVSRSRKYCQDISYQFLDETVSLIKLQIGRDKNGNVILIRHYHFEISSDGFNRFSGTACMRGRFLQSIQLDHPDGIIIEKTEK